MRNKLTTEELFVRGGLKAIDGRLFDSLEGDGMTVSAIARALRVHRPAVYASLARLVQAGLVQEGTIGRRRVYVRASAEALSDFFERSSEMIRQTVGGFAAGSGTLATGTTVLEGTEQIRLVLEWLLTETPRNGIFYRFSSRSPDVDIDAFMPPRYRDLRDKRRIQQFVITNERLALSSYVKRLDCASKYIPAREDVFEYGVNVLVYGDKVAFVNFSTRRAYVIRDRQLARLQRAIFMSLYRRLS